MILPTKGIEGDRALLAIGADVLRLLDAPKTVSRLWDEVRAARDDRTDSTPVSFDWFVLTLDLLYSLGAVDLDRGRIVMCGASTGGQGDPSRQQ